MVIENFLWCVRECNSSDDTESSSEIGDKIRAVMMVVVEGRDFGVVDSGKDDSDNGGSGRHQGRQDCKEHTKRSK